MPAAKPKKDVATTKEKPLAVVDQSMYEAEADSGFEEADKDAYAIPFLAILQSGSPQCKRSEGEYIEGAQEGMLFNTVSSEIYDGDKGQTVVPVHYKRAFVEWTPRESGGGFVAEHSAEDGLELLKQCQRNDKNQDELPNGNILVDTRSHFCLLVQDGKAIPVILAMSSTQVKKSRRWMTVMQGIKMARANGSQFTPPMFSYTYKITTVPEKNDQGSWFGWKITPDEQVTDANLFNAAKHFRDAILSGEAKAAEMSQTATAGDPEDF